MDTCVLFTGEAQKKDILTPEGEPNTQYLPDYAFENVQELLDACRSVLPSVYTPDLIRWESGA